MFNICLVEDEKSLNDLIKNYLENAGYTVIQCFNGNDAINVNEKIHLWILDIMLGTDISGYDIIKKSEKPIKKFQLYLHLQEIKIWIK